MSQPKRSELFGFNLTLFNYVCVALLLILGAMLWTGLRAPTSHQDQAAIDAARFVLSTLQPASLVKQRFQDKQQLGCDKHDLTEPLRELELRLATMAGLNADGSISGNYRLPQPLIIDAARWQDHNVSCEALRRGLALLLSQQVLEQLNWSSDTVALRQTRQRPLDAPWVTMPTHSFSRANPWGGLTGCITLGDYYLDSPRNAYCAQLAGKALKPIGDSAALLPPSLAMLLAEVDPVRMPSSAIYHQLKQGRDNRIQLPNTDYQRDLGYHLQLTLNPASQQLAQQMAKCYTGDQKQCEALGLDMSQADLYYEQARVRMTGIAIIDIASGKIEALASASTPCYQQQYDGPGRDNNCPPLPRQPRFRPDMLLNHAVYSDVMPASTIKPLLALGMLQTPGYDINQAQLTRELQTSDSAAFLNRLFCVDNSCNQGNNRAYSERLFQSQQASNQLGWNQGCQDGGRNCGFNDILLGQPLAQQPAVASRVLYGRLFTNDKQQLMPNSDFRFNPQQASACAAQKWRKCVGNAITLAASEAWGQGNARASVLGVAGMFARLGAASQGQNSQRAPYLLQAVLDVNGQALASAALQPAAPQALNIQANHAQRVVAGMGLAHQSGGTAYSACSAAGIGNCNQINWIAGKTGTPPFGADTITLEQINRECKEITKANSGRCRAEIPYKWYAALYQSNPKNPRFDKAIAVLSERNWYQQGQLAGKVDAPGDKGVNASAEMAFRIMAGARK